MKFHCGVEPLDRYFREQAGQDQRRKVAAPYVLIDASTDAVVGFYTLSAFTVSPASLPAGETKRLPSYEALPALLIGRLAVDVLYRGKGIGRLVLASALRRCLSLSKQLGAVAVVVDAKDDAARGFYEHAGFKCLEDHRLRLYIPIRSIERAGGTQRLS